MVNTQFLKRFVPFNALSEEILEFALEHVFMVKAAEGDLVLKRGKNLDNQFFLLFGSVDLVDNRFCSTKLDAGMEGAENALNPGGKAEHAVRVNSAEATLICIESEKLNELLKQNEQALARKSLEQIGSGEDWMGNLLSSPLFSFVPSKHIQSLFTHFKSRHVKAGEVIVREGEQGDCFYVVAHGVARVESKSSGQVHLLGAGQYFGEEALVGRTTRNATIVMETDGLLKVLDDKTFAEVLKDPILRYIGDDALIDIKKPYQLVDVRMPIEFKIEHVPGSKNIPLPKLREQIKQLPDSHAYVVLDDSGGRANVAAHLISQAGLEAFILAQDPKVAPSL